MLTPSIDGASNPYRIGLIGYTSDCWQRDELSGKDEPIVSLPDIHHLLNLNQSFYRAGACGVMAVPPRIQDTDP